MTNSSTLRLTGDHCVSHPSMQVAEVRAGSAGTVPPGYVALGLDAFAARLGVSRKTAHRRMERLAAQQHRPELLRVVLLPVAIGKGGRRLALHVLWPVASAAQAA